ncbi:MAG: hypothetical protein R6U98_29935 [Pirellulaceae bacterium]
MLSQMKWIRRGIAALMVVALLCGSAWAKKPPKDDDPPLEPDPPPVKYEITWVDFDVGDMVVFGMNDNGDVVGYVQSSGLYLDDPYSSSTFAYVYTPERGVMDLNTLLPEDSGWYLAYAADINNDGQIVGKGYRYGDERSRAFLYTPATEDGIPAIEELCPLAKDDDHALALQINKSGHVLGRIRDADGVNCVYLFKDEEVIPVFQSTAGTPILPRGLSDSDQILLDQDNLTMIRLYPDDEPEYFYDVHFSGFTNNLNNNGEFAGSKLFEVPINKVKTKTVWRAIRRDGVAALDLGAGDDSVGLGINNHGDVVGRLPRSEELTLNGFVYLQKFQQLVPLDDAVVGDPADVECWLLPGVNISPEVTNDTGQIAGTLRTSGLYYTETTTIAFVLTPVL